MARGLIIEPDTWLAEVWVEACRRAGHTMTQVRDGLAAIDACDNIRPEVILLEIILPGPNGISLLHELQSHADFAQIPVIVVSNLTTVTAENLHQYGVREVFCKDTVTPLQLVDAIDRVI